MKFVNRVKNVIFSPRAAFQNILAEGFSMTEPVGIVLGINFLNALLFGIGAIRGMNLITDFISRRVHISPEIINLEIDVSGVTGILLAIFLGMAVFYAIYSLFPWIINAGIGHIMAKHVFNGLGDFESLLCTFGYSQITAISLTLGLLVFIIYPVTGLFVLLAMGIVKLIWSIVLRTLSVSEVYGLDLGRSFISVIMPYLLLLAFGLISSGFPFFFFKWC